MDTDLITLIAAIAATVISLGALVHLVAMVQRWPRATGEVTGNIAEWAHSTSGKTEVYFAKIAFTDATGQRFTVKGDIGRRKPWPIGEKVTVRYKAANPNNATSMNFWQRLLFAGVFGFFAVMLWLAWFEVIG
jgi:hypothetical protein